MLMKLAVQLLSAEGKSWFIGVDECRRLGRRKIYAEGDVASALGELAVELEQMGVQCTVMLTSLTHLSFKTVSNRSTKDLTLPKPTHEMVEFVMKAMGVDLKHRDVVALVSGGHLRSMVIACQVIIAGQALSTRDIFVRTRERLAGNLGLDSKHAIHEYIVDTLRHGKDRHLPELAELYTDASGAIAPVFCMAAFDGYDAFAEGLHPAVQIFTPTDAGGPTKRLEECAAAYDRLRALYKATAIPRDIRICSSSENPSEDWTWWMEAKALSHMTVNNHALFCVKGKKVARTDVVPGSGTYYLPSAPNHPLVDRAFVTSTPKSGLISFQEKMNGDIKEAAKALNEAAKLFGNLNMPALCVAHCVGAKSSTSASLNTPHVILTEENLDKFYTPTFAPAVRYLMTRHQTGSL